MPSGPHLEVPVQQLGTELTSWLYTDTGPCSSGEATSKTQMTRSSLRPLLVFLEGAGQLGGRRGALKGTLKRAGLAVNRAPPGPGTAGGLLVLLMPRPGEGALRAAGAELYRPAGAGLGTGLAGLPARRCRAAKSLGEVLGCPERREGCRREAGVARACPGGGAAGEPLGAERAGRFSPVCVHWWRSLAACQSVRTSCHARPSQAKGRSPVWRTDSQCWAGVGGGGKGRSIRSQRVLVVCLTSSPPQNSLERLNSGCGKACQMYKRRLTHFPNTVNLLVWPPPDCQ